MINQAEHIRKVSRILFLLIFLLAGYFSNAGSWNQNARLNSIFAYVEPGPDRYTFHFDRFMTRPELNLTTGDWSKHSSHYYSNKAPGTTLFGIIPYSFLYLLETSQNVDLENPYISYANRYLINLAVSVFPLACAVVALLKLLVSLGHSIRRAALVCLCFAFGTILFPYSTQLWGHTTAASLVVISLQRFYDKESPSFFWSGCYAGLAVCTDYFAALAAIAIFLLAAKRNFRCCISIFAGGLIPAILLGTYHTICFGSPFSLPTDYTNPAFIDPGYKLGLFGSISIEALWQLTFGEMRGLFFTMPLLFCSVLGFYFWAKDAKSRALCFASVLVIVGLLLLNASFNGWHAGASVAARYQIVALPFWILPLVYIPRKFFKFCLLPAVLSAFQMLAIAAVSPIAPDIGSPPRPHPSPMLDWVYPKFLAGDLAQFVYPMRFQFFNPDISQFINDSSWNFGMILGTRNLYTLLPLVVLTVSTLLLLYRTLESVDNSIGISSEKEAQL